MFRTAISSICLFGAIANLLAALTVLCGVPKHDYPLVGFPAILVAVLVTVLALLQKWIK